MGALATGQVESTRDPAGTVTIALGGHLDASTGTALVDTLRSELTRAPQRIDIDLSVLASFADDGAAALLRCRDLCGDVPGGLHYRTEGGAGQHALLQAFEREPEIDQV
jgi:ABC-type transporter Mla MlaB component